MVVDQDTYWNKHGIDTPRHEDPSEEYGFPPGEEALEDEDGKPLERALVCCHPQVGVFSLRDKEWGLSEATFDPSLGLLTIASVCASRRPPACSVPREGFQETSHQR